MNLPPTTSLADYGEVAARELVVDRRRRRVANGCFASGCGLAFLVLLSWLAGRWQLGTLGDQHVPMAPSTALLLLSLSGAAFLRLNWPNSAAVCRFGRAVGAGVLALNLLLCGQILFGFPLPVEEWLAPTTETVGQIRVGRMSLMTAAVFLLSTLSFLFGLCRDSGGPRWPRQAAAVAALAVLLFSFGVVLSYALGEPLLYGGTVVPMAALTALGFVVLGLGLLLRAGSDTWPLSFFSPSAQAAPFSRRFALEVVALPLLILAYISAVGWLYLKARHDEAQRGAHETLAAIADLKLGQIVQWRAERLADAEYLRRIPDAALRALEILDQPDSLTARRTFSLWMASLYSSGEYDRITLLDEQLQPALVYPQDDRLREIDESARRAAEQALRSQEVTTSDLESPPDGGYLSIMVPLTARGEDNRLGSGAVAFKADRSAGVLVLRINARHFLYSLLRHWPMPSRTAETLLARRDGDEVIFLSEPRHSPRTAARLRLPVEDPNLLAALAARGKEGMVEGLDYRGVPALAALRKIPGTPWFMVAKVDQEEVHAPFRRDAMKIGLIVGLLLLAAFMALALAWRQQKLESSRRELTGRKETERALRERAAELRNLAESMPQMVWKGRADGWIVYANQRWVDYTGLTLAETHGEGWAKPVHPDDLQRASTTWQTALQNGADCEMECRLSDRYGKYNWFLVRVVSQRDETGAVFGWLGACTNIDEQKRAAEALRLSEEKFRQLADNITDAFWIASPDLKSIHYASPGYELLTGRSRESWYANPDEWAASIVPEDLERVLAVAEALKRDESQVSVEYRVAHPDGGIRWVHTRGFQVRDAAGKLVRLTGIATDITDRKLAEASLEDANRKLRDASRQAGMAEVATNVLHNVGNVLNSVVTSAGVVMDNVRKSKISSLDKVVAMLREHEPNLASFITSDSRGRQLPEYLAQLSSLLLADRAETLKELESLRSNIEHINQIVAMQQRYATVSGVKEIIDLRELVEDSLRLNLGALDRHGVELIREFEAVPPLNVDKHRILQILVNLVRNAKYACDDSGRADKQVTVRVSNGHGQVLISVTDNGVGLPPENLTRIFFHGFTTRKDGHGFGLHSGALAAKEMGGSLRVHSDGPGKGATFTLELPCKTHEVL